MTRELFLDEAGIASSSGVAIVPVEGESLGMKLDVGASGAHDERRVYWGSAAFIGSRLHYWYNFTTILAGTTYTGTAYAYSDDKGATWVKPNLGLVSWDGSTANNILQLNDSTANGTRYICGVIHRPDDAKPFKSVWFGVDRASGGNEPDELRIYEHDDHTLQSGTLIRTGPRAYDHTTAATMNDGRACIVVQGLTEDAPGGAAYRRRQCGVHILDDLATDPDNIAWDAGWSVYGGMVDGGQNVISRQADTDYHPERDEHGGDYLLDTDDLWGHVTLIGVQMMRSLAADDVGLYANWWETCGYALRDTAGVIAHGDIYRIGAYGETLAAPSRDNMCFDPPKTGTYDAGGDWNGGAVSLVPGSFMSDDDYDYMLESGWQVSYAAYVLNPNFVAADHDRFRAGVRRWRKDGLTKLTGTGTFTTPLATKAAGHVIRCNHVGSVSCELRDASDAVITGYSAAECDGLTGDSTGGYLTWGGNTASELTEFKMAWTVDGDLYAYEFVAPPPLTYDLADGFVWPLASAGAEAAFDAAASAYAVPLVAASADIASEAHADAYSVPLAQGHADMLLTAQGGAAQAVGDTLVYELADAFVWPLAVGYAEMRFSAAMVSAGRTRYRIKATATQTRPTIVATTVRRIVATPLD
jgi:hypothetical protein